VEAAALRGERHLLGLEEAPCKPALGADQVGVLCGDDDAAAGARKVKAGKNFRASALKQVTFVPSSQNVAFKEKISAVGNTKTRIKNMKVWGREMM